MKRRRLDARVVVHMTRRELEDFRASLGVPLETVAGSVGNKGGLGYALLLVKGPDVQSLCGGHLLLHLVSMFKELAFSVEFDPDEPCNE